MTDSYVLSVLLLPVGVGTIIHTTWEGSGFHVPSFPHTELVCDKQNPDS